MTQTQHGPFTYMRYWKNSNPDKGPVKFTNTLTHSGRVTLRELDDFLAEHLPEGVSGDDVTINASIKWEDDPTPEELEQNREFEAERAERYKEWRKSQYKKLYEEFGGKKPK